MVRPVLALIALLGCEAERLNNQSRPTDETEKIDGYLESNEREVTIDTDTEITISKTKLIISKNSAQTNFKVRLARRGHLPELTNTEAAVIGNAQGDIVDIAMFDPLTNSTISSDDLLIPYRFEQQISQTDSTQSNLGLMVITDPGSSVEKRVLIPRSELNISSGVGLNLLNEVVVADVSLNLKLTSAIIWPVIYSDEALTLLEIATAADLASSGGTQTSTTVIRTSAIQQASIKINSDASYTNSASVSLQLSGIGANEMYITNEQGCSSGGQWEAFSESKTWTLSSLNAIARVYVRLRSADGSASSCLSDSITHDNQPPVAPSSFTTLGGSSSLTSTPSFQWDAGTDAESGISHYEIAVGTTAGATDVKNWQDVGKGLSNAIGGLSLTHQVTYYPSIRSVDLAGNISSNRVGTSWVASNQQVDLQTGLVLHLDSKNARLAGPPECDYTPNWRDQTETISEGSVVLHNMSLDCAANNSGWANVDPYELEFDGIDDYVNASTNSAYNFDRADAFTVMARIKTGSDLSTPKAIISKLRSASQSSGSFFGYELFLQATGTIDLLIDRSFTSYRYIRSTTIATTNQIYDVVATYDQTNMKLYINGVLEGEETFEDASTGPPLGPLFLGMRNTGTPQYPFNGSIYSVRIYNRALNASEVAALSD
jgi:hypothetical protein